MPKQFYNIETIVPLQEKVVAIWSTESKLPYAITPELLIPNGYVQLLFVINGGYKRRKLSTAQEQFQVKQSVIIGVQDKVIMSQNIGELTCVGVEFDPMQFYLLFGDLGVTACNSHIPIEASGQDALIQLNKKILKATSIPEALNKIESFFVNYPRKIEACETWQLTKNCLQDLRNKNGNTEEVNSNLLSMNFKKFTGFTFEEMSTIIKIASTSIEPSIKESVSFLSIKNLFKDIDKNENNPL